MINDSFENNTTTFPQFDWLTFETSLLPYYPTVM